MRLSITECQIGLIYDIRFWMTAVKLLLCICHSICSSGEQCERWASDWTHYLSQMLLKHELFRFRMRLLFMHECYFLPFSPWSQDVHKTIHTVFYMTNYIVWLWKWSGMNPLSILVRRLNKNSPIPRNNLIFVHFSSSSSSNKNEWFH